MPATRPSSFGKDVVLRIGGRERFNYVLLSAADEDEKSIATRKGSLFTLGLAYALEQSAKRGQTVTPTGLRRGNGLRPDRPRALWLLAVGRVVYHRSTQLLPYRTRAGQGPPRPSARALPVRHHLQTNPVREADRGLDDLAPDRPC